LRLGWLRFEGCRAGVTDTVHTTPASAEDLITIRSLLEEAGLPTSDLDSARPEFVVLRADGRVTAAGALQHFGDSALLRSVVVAAARRGRGLGQTVVGELERRARSAHIGQLFLLTQTASDFFARLGYRIIERASAPPDMQQSEEFRSLCPASAICMCKVLHERASPSD
jgi:amino-acid N-acetyltransferase